VVSSSTAIPGEWKEHLFTNTNIRYVKLNITNSTYDWDGVDEFELYLN
jgi:hypothetical protein